MITEAIVIGAVDAAVYWEGEHLCAVRLESAGDELIDCSRDVGLLLSTGAEKRRLAQPPHDLEELQAQLREWSGRHRALTMMISGMDPQLTRSTRRTCILAAEQGLCHPSSAAFARARLLSCALPEEADLEGALSLAFEGSANSAAALYGDLSKALPYVAKVRESLERLLRYEFDDGIDPEIALRALIESGTIADALDAIARRDRASLNGLVFKYQEHPEVVSAVPRAVHLLARFIAEIGNAYDWLDLGQAAPADEIDIWQYNEDAFVAAVKDWVADAAFRGGRQRQRSSAMSANEAFEQVGSQKAFVIDYLQKNRLGRAEKAVLALIRSQRRHSTIVNQRRQSGLELLCKSLSDLGATAIRLSYFEFAQRLYVAAQVANQRDPVPFSGYAETLRKLGRPEEALAVYHDAKAAFPHDVVSFTGYAETLRQLGRPEEALSVYGDAKAAFPHEAVPFTGYAETLRQLGRPEEALAVYGDAKAAFPHHVVPFNGYAETLRQLGRPDEALAAYGDAKAAFPHEVYAFTGYAETLRQLGRPDEALAVYGDAKAAFPHDVVPFTGYAETLRQLGRPDEAEAAFRSALDEFPGERVAKNALACLLVEKGLIVEARALIPVQAPQSEDDWRDYHVVAMTFLKEKNYDEAEKRLAYGTHVAPFHSARDVFRGALAFAKLCRKRYAEVISVTQPDNVLEFRRPAVEIMDAHARAALGEFDRAETSLRHAERSHSTEVIRLSDFVRKRYGLSPYSGLMPQVDEAAALDEIIAEAEFDLALRAAA
jgi:tetratricopeptide (TPR) repeat protein